MSVEITRDVEIVAEAVEVTNTLSGDTVSASDHCVGVETADNITIIGLQKDYSIVGDALYASVNTEDAPTWLVSLVDGVVTNQIAAGFVDYDNLAQDVQNAIASIETASNTYVQTVQYDIDQAGIVGSVVTQLNATYDLDNIHSTITNIDVVIANENASQGLTLANIQVNYEGYTNSEITTLNTALSTAIGSNASSINVLNAAYTDPVSGLLANANAIQTLEVTVDNLSTSFFALESGTNPGTIDYDYYYDPVPVDGTNLKLTLDSSTVTPAEGNIALVKVLDGTGEDIYVRHFKGGVWVEGTPSGIVAGAKYALDLNAYLGGKSGTSWGGETSLVNEIVTTSKGEIYSSFQYNSELYDGVNYYKTGFGLDSTTTGGDGSQGNPFTSEFWVQADTFRVTSPGNADFEFLIDGINNKVVMDAADIVNLGAQTITTTTTGHIKGGQTSYNTGTGYFLGYNAGAYKLSIGSSTKGLTWDGSDLSLTGATVDIKSATSGARMEIKNDVIKVYDSGGVLRVQMGNLLA